MKNNANLPLVVGAILAEYQARNSEIQRRSSSEDTFIQYHITVLTAILSGVLILSSSDLSEIFNVGKWLIFLIPIESALFGLWWFGNSLPIGDNGKYIRLYIEPKVNKLLDTEDVLAWETFIYSQGKKKTIPKNKAPLKLLIFSTFALPGILSIFLASLFLLLSILNTFHLLPVSTLVPTKAFYSDIYLGVALLLLVVDIFFIVQLVKVLGFGTIPFIKRAGSSVG